MAGIKIRFISYMINKLIMKSEYLFADIKTRKSSLTIVPSFQISSKRPYGRTMNSLNFVLM